MNRREFFKNLLKKKEEPKQELTPVMFDGYISDMYLEKMGSSKLLIGLMDYLGEDFTDLLLTRYDVKVSDELMKAINDRRERNKNLNHDLDLVKCVKDYTAICGGGETFFKKGSYYDANQPYIGLSGSTINMSFINGKRFGIEETIFETLSTIK